MCFFPPRARSLSISLLLTHSRSGAALLRLAHNGFYHKKISPFNTKYTNNERRRSNNKKYRTLTPRNTRTPRTQTVLFAIPFLYAIDISVAHIPQQLNGCLHFNCLHCSRAPFRCADHRRAHEKKTNAAEKNRIGQQNCSSSRPSPRFSFSRGFFVLSVVRLAFSRCVPFARTTFARRERVFYEMKETNVQEFRFTSFWLCVSLALCVLALCVCCACLRFPSMLCECRCDEHK